MIERDYRANVDARTQEDDEARYLDAASPDELAEYRQMSPPDREHTVKTWLAYNL